MLVTMQGCALFQERACGEAETPAVTDTVYFGTAKPGGVITQDEWSAFVLSPRSDDMGGCRSVADGKRKD
jgi:hypothetical protein